MIKHNITTGYLINFWTSKFEDYFFLFCSNLYNCYLFRRVARWASCSCVHCGCLGYHCFCEELPTNSFSTLELQNPWIDEFYVVQESRATDFKAPKLWKGSSGFRYCLPARPTRVITILGKPVARNCHSKYWGKTHRSLFLGVLLSAELSFLGTEHFPRIALRLCRLSFISEFPPRPALSQLKSLKIRRSANFIKFKNEVPKLGKSRSGIGSCEKMLLQVIK